MYSDFSLTVFSSIFWTFSLWSLWGQRVALYVLSESLGECGRSGSSSLRCPACLLPMRPEICSLFWEPAECSVLGSPPSCWGCIMTQHRTRVASAAYCAWLVQVLEHLKELLLVGILSWNIIYSLESPLLQEYLLFNILKILLTHFVSSVLLLKG